MTPEEIKENFSTIKESLDERPNYFNRNKTVQKIANELLEKDAKIVEVGCGQGILTTHLLESGFSDIECIDIDNYLSDELKQKVRIHLQDICFKPLPQSDASTNAVFAIAIIEHLENPLFILREAARVLQDGGYYIVAIPHIFSLRARIEFLFTGDMKGYKEGNNHITLQTRAVFKKLYLKDFDLAETKYSDGYIKIPFIGKKIKTPKFFGSLFSDKVLYVLKRKERST